MSSILKDVKQALGVDRNDDSFDIDLCLHINTALSIVKQIGLQVPFRVEDDSAQWSDLYDDPELDVIREIVTLHCRLAFDPASYSFVNSAYEKLLEEDKVRLSYALEVR